MFNFDNSSQKRYLGYMKNLTKTTLLMSLLCLIHHQAAAQINLVPNPSFEEYEWCPTCYPDLDGNLKYWTSFRLSPDFINECSSTCGFYNQYGYQHPKSGMAYTGFGTYQTTIPDLREHIGVKLTSPLDIGAKYFVSFYVSSAFNQQVNVATNNLGALVTTNKYYDPNGMLPIQNYSTVNANSIIKDTFNWIKISGSFIADSSYEYLVIGNFFDNSNTDTFYLPDLAFGHFVSYYYLDDVCLSEDSSLCFSDKAKCDFVLPSAFYPNGDNINDLYSPFPESVHMQVFRIYNRWGQKIYEVMDTNAAWDGKFNGEPQPSDVYAFYLEVKNEKTGKTEQRSGSFTLLR